MTVPCADHELHINPDSIQLQAAELSSSTPRIAIFEYNVESLFAFDHSSNIMIIHCQHTCSIT